MTQRESCKTPAKHPGGDVKSGLKPGVIFMRSPNAPNEKAGTLVRELLAINKQIKLLDAYKVALQGAIRARKDLNGFVYTSGAAYRPHPVFLNHGKSSDTRSQSLEMARMILQNLNGDEKTPNEIRELIRATYGVEQVKSLEQMLYKRSVMVGSDGRKGRTFYKTADGRFGLVAFRPIIEEVRMPSTANA